MADQQNGPPKFGRSVATLMTGTVIAQALPLLITPILTRIYTPEQFGTLALYLAVVFILVSLATLRFELAIIMPESDEDGFAVFLIACLTAAIFCLLTAAIIAVFQTPIVRLLGDEHLATLLYLVPFSVFFLALFSATNFWNNRQTSYGLMAQTKVVQSAGTATGQATIPSLAKTESGLVYGSLLGYAAAVAFVTKKNWSAYRALWSTFQPAHLIANAKRYKNYPLYSTWGSLADKVSLQLPVFVIVRSFSTHLTGVYMLTMRALSVPAMMIGEAIGKVLLQRLAQMQRESPELMFRYVFGLFWKLLLLTVPGILVLVYCGEPIFTIVFGEQWTSAGRFAGILVIPAALRFAVSPLSMVLALDHNIRLGTLWQLIYLTTIIPTLWFASSYSFDRFLWIFVGHEIVLYLLYLMFILHGSRQRPADEVVPCVD